MVGNRGQRRCDFDWRWRDLRSRRHDRQHRHDHSFNTTGNNTSLVAGPGGATLSDGGAVVLSDNPNNGNTIFGVSASATLTNVDNTISGAG
jgi:hypothetical protein